MANIEAFFMRLTEEETKEALGYALEFLPQEMVIEQIREWITEHKLEGEFDFGE